MTKLNPRVALAACVLTICATSAMAGPRSVGDDAAPSVVVSFADLNLQRDADVQTLLGRLSSAARNVCGAFNAGQKGAYAHHAFVVCRSTAMQGVVASIASAKLSAAYAARTSGQFALADRRP